MRRATTRGLRCRRSGRGRSSLPPLDVGIPTGERHRPQTASGRSRRRPQQERLADGQNGGHGVGEIDDIDDDKQDSVEELIDDLANESFENADFGD
ncbi:hypothetical protein C476_12096 [Natrinema limicola JCM 13563]|uniref:Uncharacterized protein n=1 Tax=Natrinema limicola JCM 13563 TaxID=1230457 RepID=M0CBA8_9EURY|nr:hypothetical protein C476_12096 [Natrinema limicola JCM 13563]